MEKESKKDFTEKLAELITKNPIPSLVALMMFILLSKDNFILGVVSFFVVFGIFYLRQNAFNPFAEKWIRIGGIAIITLWILSLYIRSN